MAPIICVHVKGVFDSSEWTKTRKVTGVLSVSSVNLDTYAIMCGISVISVHAVVGGKWPASFLRKANTCYGVDNRNICHCSGGQGLIYPISDRLLNVIITKYYLSQKAWSALCTHRGTVCTHYRQLWIIWNSLDPANTQCRNNVVTTSPQRHDVAATL